MRKNENQTFEVNDTEGNKTRNLFITIGGSILAVLLIAGVVHMGSTKVTKATETVVGNYLKEYGAGFTDDEIKELTRTLSTKVDESLSTMNWKELSEENLQQIMQEVRNEIAQSTYTIPDEEAAKIAADVLQRVLTAKAEEDMELAEKYTAQIESLQNQLNELKERDYLTESNVADIVQKYTLDKQDIINMLENEYYSDVLVKKMSETYNLTTKDIYKLIAENKSYGTKVYEQLASELGTDSNSIKELFEKYKSVNEAIEALSKSSDTSVETIQKLIAESEELSKNEIQRLENSLGIQNSSLERLAEETKSDISSLKTELSNMTDVELEAIREEMSKSDTDLQELIDATKKSLLGSQNELEAATATKEALQQAIQTINEAIAGNSADLVDAQTALNEAIATSSGEQQRLLEEAQLQLEAIINGNATDTQNELNSIKASLESNVTDIEADIVSMGRTITGLEGSIKDNAKDIENLDSIKAEIRYSNDNGTPTLTIGNVIKE